MSDIEKSIETSPPPGDPEKASITAGIIKHADRNDADEALKILEGENGEVVEITAEDERKLLRKIDLHIMPLLCIVYGSVMIPKI